MRQIFISAALALLMTGMAQAQDQLDVPPAAGVSRYDSPREATARQRIQRRAAHKAAQRRRRLEAYRWMGYSPSRPPVSAMQMMGAGDQSGVGVLYYNFPGMLMSWRVMQPR